jgi:predicted aldo/keto reductase-like oxidoreductase
VRPAGLGQFKKSTSIGTTFLINRTYFLESMRRFINKKFNKCYCAFIDLYLMLEMDQMAGC